MTYDKRIELPKPWYWTDQDLSKQLQTELSDDHQLKNKSVKTIARRQDRDDVLFEFDDNKFAVIHMTWQQTAHSDTRWPTTKFFSDWKDVYDNCILPDSRDFN